MAGYTYTPKAQVPTAEEYRTEQERYKQLIKSVDKLKTEHTLKLKHVRRELLARKAWLIRYKYLFAAAKQSSQVNVAANLSPEELEHARRTIFNS